MRIKRSLKIVALVLATLLFFPSAALAALPNNTIIFGTKAYDLSLLNDASLANEILAAFVANGNSFAYKMPAGNLIDPNAQAVDPATLPAISYMDADKVVTGYRAGDGDVIAPLSVYLASTASGIGKVATLTADGYPTALQYRLLKADGTVLTQKVNVGSSVVVMFLNPGDTCKVELYDAAGTLLDTQTVTTQTGSAPAVALTVILATASIQAGHTQQITATVTPTDATVTYITSDTSKATVSSTGLITGVAAGSAIISVTAAKTGMTSGTATVNITVTAADEKTLAITAAINVINALPATNSLTLSNKTAVEAARALLVDTAKTKGAVDADITNLWVLAAAEAKITELEAAATAAELKAAAITDAINAIDALPATASLTLANKTAVEDARALVNHAKTVHSAVDADITNLATLVADEAKIVDLGIVKITVPATLTVEAGKTAQITTTVTPSDAAVTYQSSDETKATVSATGLVSGIAAGSATITVTAAKAGRVSASAIVSVTVFETSPTITGVTATNGTVSVTLSSSPTVVPVASDFSFTASVNGGAASVLPVEGFAWNSGTKTASFTFPPKGPPRTSQSVVVAAAYKNSTPVNAPAFTVLTGRGYSRSSPARIGDVFTIVGGTTSFAGFSGRVVFTLGLVDIVSGYQAWSIVYAANMFNDVPPAGKEYVLAKFRIRLLETAGDRSFSLWHAYFNAVSQAGITYSDFICVAGLSPDLDTDLYPGADFQGWTYFLVYASDHPVTVFQRNTPLELWFDLRP